MHSVEESLLRSRSSVGREIKRKQMRRSSEAECIQSRKACYEAAIQSESLRESLTGELLGKKVALRVARQVTGRVAGRVAFHVAPPSKNALGESAGE
jgi:hypothetical protein